MSIPEELRAIKPKPLQGHEPFLQGDGEAGFCVLDFWKWYASDLMSNALRGVVAEFLVARALGLCAKPRVEWRSCDLLTEDGKKIEVKSFCPFQSWDQERPSVPRFGVAQTRAWIEEGNKYENEARRQADVYVFCVLVAPTKAEVNPLDVDQWQFYVLPVARLGGPTAGPKSIGLAALQKLQPAVGYRRLRAAIEKAAAAE